jgi:stage II sporulation protein D
MISLDAAPRVLRMPIVKVGISTDQPRVELPRVRGGYVLIADDGCFAIQRGIIVTAPRAGAPLRYGVEILCGARDDSDIDAAIAAAGAGPVERRIDTIGDNRRVIAGDVSDPAAATRLRRALAAAGLRARRILPLPSTCVAALLHIRDDEGECYERATRSLLVVPERDPIMILGKPYRGGLRASINLRGLINVINELELEDYVRGVVPVELEPDRHGELEAQKAQALAARTYVLYRLGELAHEGYDTLPTPECQVYGGMAVEHPLSSRAVDETAGLVITWRGKPIDAMFTSTCGGATSDVSTMFPRRGPRPYLRSAICDADETSPFSTWTRSYRAEELVRTVARHIPIGELHGLEPLITDASGRVAELAIATESGRTTLRGVEIRFALGVPDTLFVIERSHDSDGVARYTFVGRGWGHGTGMCQVGAFGMAARGASAEQIISRYYHDVVIAPYRARG